MDEGGGDLAEERVYLEKVKTGTSGDEDFLLTETGEVADDGAGDGRGMLEREVIEMHCWGQAQVFWDFVSLTSPPQLRMEEGLPIYHGQSVARNSAMGYYSGTGDDYQRSQTHSAQPNTTQSPPSMSFYPSSVASSEYYPRHDAYAPSALYGAHHVVRNPASTPSSPYYYPNTNEPSLSLDPASPAPIRKAAGFRRVRDHRDLRTALTSSRPAVSSLLSLLLLS
jgi:hypothetical protein